MKKPLLLVLFNVLLYSSIFALPGFEISVGPYLGICRPSLKTLNDKVLIYEHQTAIGSAGCYGLQVAVGFPLGIGGGISVGKWDNEKNWSDDQGDLHSHKIKLLPMDMFVQYSIPIVPKVVKGKVGVTVGKTWAEYNESEVRPNQWNHYDNSEGNAGSFGLFGGIDLVTIPKVNIGAEIGYKSCKIGQLTIVGSHEQDHINDVLEYYNRDVAQDLPLPLELNGLTAKLIVSYVF